jgi:hypothetical protein
MSTRFGFSKKNPNFYNFYKNIFIPTLPFSEQILIHYIHSRILSATKKDYFKKSKNGHF